MFRFNRSCQTLHLFQLYALYVHFFLSSCISLLVQMLHLLSMCSPSHGEPQIIPELCGPTQMLPLHPLFPDPARRSELGCSLLPRYPLGVPVATIMDSVAGGEGAGSMAGPGLIVSSAPQFTWTRGKISLSTGKRGQ